MEDTTEQQVGKTAALVVELEKRHRQTEQQLHLLAMQWDAMARQTVSEVRQSIDGVLSDMPRQVQRYMESNMQSAIGAGRVRLEAVIGDAEAASGKLTRQFEALRKVSDRLIWKVLGVAIGSLTLLLGGGMWLSVHYAKVIRDNQVDAELMRLFNASDVRRCGDGLCANVDLKGQRYGDKHQYLQVKPH